MRLQGDGVGHTCYPRLISKVKPDIQSLVQKPRDSQVIAGDLVQNHMLFNLVTQAAGEQILPRLAEQGLSRNEPYPFIEPGSIGIHLPRAPFVQSVMKGIGKIAFGFGGNGQFETTE